MGTHRGRAVDHRRKLLQARNLISKGIKTPQILMKSRNKCTATGLKEGGQTKGNRTKKEETDTREVQRKKHVKVLIRRSPRLNNPTGSRGLRRSTRPTKPTNRYQACMFEVNTRSAHRAETTRKVVKMKKRSYNKNAAKPSPRVTSAFSLSKKGSGDSDDDTVDEDSGHGATADEESIYSVSHHGKRSRASSSNRGPTPGSRTGTTRTNTPTTNKMHKKHLRSSLTWWSAQSRDVEEDDSDDEEQASNSSHSIALNTDAFYNKRREKLSGARLADIDPMAIDQSVNFESIGGLSGHISALKEMVVFPLLYPEVFDNFKIQPPRGCLFYGPPGTGKTLVARALANECSHGNRKVAFFMRKGADCLSKWVGESERQLRLLFEQAYLKRPSIIFFDEIDGLAPVRSSRQDQIHSSIVSTLLALMDGLDSRGEVVVIGATNRLDSIDPALRRPGRFDREFLFGLPDRESRREILKIHTCQWKPAPSEDFLEELAEKCVGYCGADIRAVCTEAALCALRRRYPQIYGSSQKLLLDVSSICISSCDFVAAMRKMCPASHRSAATPSKPLTPLVQPLLGRALQNIMDVLQKLFPHAEQGLKRKREPDLTSGVYDDGLMYGSDETSISSPSVSSHGRRFLHFARSAVKHPTSHRPRMLLVGRPGAGESSHLAPAILHALERFTVHSLDTAVLFGVSTSSAEETCAQVFCEARRTSPSILYIPHVQQWWDIAGSALRASFLSLLGSIPSFSPIFLLATASMPHNELDPEIQYLFREEYGEVYTLNIPTRQERTNFFQDLILNQAAEAPPSKLKKKVTETLPLAPLPVPRQLSEEELLCLEEQEEDVLRELRLFLRNITERLMLDRRFKAFTKPVDIDKITDYYIIIKKPMDLSTLLFNIDEHKYLTISDFISDADLIWQNALEYNPDISTTDRHLRHRAFALKDMLRAIIKDELDEDFERMCWDVRESRINRGFYGDRMQPVCRELADGRRQSQTCKKKRSRKSKWSHGVIPKAKRKQTLVQTSSSGSSTSSDTSLDSSSDESSLETDSESSLFSWSDSSSSSSLTDTITRYQLSLKAFPKARYALMNGYRDHLPDGKQSSDNGNQSRQSHVGDSGEDPLALDCSDSFQIQLETDGLAEAPRSETPPLVIDSTKLRELLNRVVAKTEGAEVEPLEKLYALLAQSIYRHRDDYNKIELVKDMRTEIANFSAAAK